MITSDDERLVELFFKAETARIAARLVPFSDGEYTVDSKSDRSTSHFVKILPYNDETSRLVCSCQFDAFGEPRACTHAALALYRFSEPFRLKIADERDRRRLEELKTYRDGSVNKRSLAAQIRALEVRLGLAERKKTRVEKLIEKHGEGRPGETGASAELGGDDIPF